MRLIVLFCATLLLAVPGIAANTGPAQNRAMLGYVRVRLVTSEGNIVVALDAKRAPKTTANFLNYVDDGRLEGTVFYRAARTKGAAGTGFIQGGIRTDLRRRLPPVVLEPTSQTGLRHIDGTISLAHGDDPNSGDANFSLLVGGHPQLDANGKSKGFAAFGRVIEGMPVVRRILAMATGGGSGAMKGQMLLRPVQINRAERLDGRGRPAPAFKPWLIGARR
ncbi:peptidylprolyl isomerase [Sphingomonas sp. LB-2]|uniref:peptidylprolyl isomerase n=1 Tax=Sphingomonas caeni TaxID=2984949 RepID=UPI00222E954F|nr:peptidylprolyl isomerase [Sphingomonas caeni]MCW3847406.1 peptidylprolyl isomerase [Sphingomonas caeni]